ncbi:MAG: SDR family NAD(P)-dependent oxidoreductase [Vulcanimicrobiota bacterium]
MSTHHSIPSSSERLLSTGLGALLAARSWDRSWTGTLLGAALVFRGLSGYCPVYQKLAQLREHDALNDQVALVTGGSRGLGLCLVEELASRGARVAFCARTPDTVETTENQLRERGYDVRGYVCDVAHREQVHAMMARIRSELGTVRILVNNAGIIKVAPLEALTEKDFHECLNVNFWGILNTCLEALPDLKAQGGRILNITSLSGKMPAPHLLAYNCAKAAAVALSEGLTLELDRCGITVTTAVPGLMRTGSHVNARFGGDAESEYAWFSRAAVHPALAADSRRAAHDFVEAALAGKPEILYGWEPTLGTRFHALFPGLNLRLNRLIQRLLPEPSHQPVRSAGRQLRPLKPMGSRLEPFERQALERLQGLVSGDEPTGG